MPEQQNPALRIEQASLDHLRAIAESGELYAVADATDAPAVPKKVLELGPQRAVSLYRGTAEEQFWDVAPYLMHVDPPVLDWILSTLDKTRWGIFVVSKANLDTLRTHFRHFLKVQSPEGEIWHFRFYDPRVLGPFLQCSQPPELRQIFGQVTAIGLIGPDDAVSMLGERPKNSAAIVDSKGPHFGVHFALRPEHLKAFQPQAEADFVNRLVQHLRDGSVGEAPALTNEVLIARVQAGIARARRYGLARESKLAAFVALMFEFAPNFDENPRIQAILRNAQVPPDEKIYEVVDRTSEEDWAMVEQSSNPSAWQLPDQQIQK